MTPWNTEQNRVTYFTYNLKTEKVSILIKLFIGVEVFLELLTLWTRNSRKNMNQPKVEFRNRQKYSISRHSNPDHLPNLLKHSPTYLASHSHIQSINQFRHWKFSYDISDEVCTEAIWQEYCIILSLKVEKYF